MRAVSTGCASAVAADSNAAVATATDIIRVLACPLMEASPLSPIRRFGPDLRDEVREIEVPASVVGAATLLSARRLCRRISRKKTQLSLIFWEFFPPPSGTD